MNKATDLPTGGPAIFGMRLLIFSLSVLFIAGLVGYGITRQRLGLDGAVAIPDLLYVSTAVLLVTGISLEAAGRRLRRDAVRQARTLLLVTLGAAAGFLAVQIPALAQLLTGHRDAAAAGNPLLGFVFFLILLHAVHVVGGLVAFAVVVGRSRHRSLSIDEDGAAVRLCTTYWHFLEIVWAVMFVVFLAS